MRKLMFFLIGLLAVFNLISAYASYNNDKFEAVEEEVEAYYYRGIEGVKNYEQYLR